MGYFFIVKSSRLKDIKRMPYLEFQYYDQRETIKSEHKKTIWLFGGSAAYGWGVDYTETIASYLANEYTVVNHGTPAYNSSQELIKLIFQLRDNPKPDIIIFYDGFNDIWLAYTDGKAGYPIRWWKSEREFFLLRKTMFHYLFNRFYPHTAGADDQTGREAKRIYESNIEFARDICEKYGVEFHRFKQPYNDSAFPEKARTFMRKFYEPDFYIDDELFIDSCHLTARGNELIAGMIFDEL